MHPVRREDRQRRIAADEQRIGEPFAQRPRGEGLGGGHDVIDPEGHHPPTLGQVMAKAAAPTTPVRAPAWSAPQAVRTQPVPSLTISAQWSFV
ncbi:hypothetical protein GCM10022214_61010 [Actinomadura miaoliensis]|uniref:Uncharacterized protein n=1 Tax=Actinomadura miaoliensis TaxID=430685 RepID=A0ABP7WLN4_9ACTN